MTLPMTARLLLVALLLTACARNHGRGGPDDPDDSDVPDRPDMASPVEVDRGTPPDPRDAGRDAGSQLDEGVDFGVPITCPTEILPRPVVELPDLPDEPTFSIAATDDGFAVLTSRRERGILRPELWRFDVESGVGRDVDLGRLPFDGWIGSSSIVAEGSTLWVALTEVGPTINRTALLRVEGEPPYAQQTVFLPLASRVSQLTPTGEPGVLDALLENAAEPTLQVVRLSFDDGIVSGPVDLPPEGTVPDRITRRWLPSGRVLGLRERFRMTPASLQSWSLDLDGDGLGERNTLVEWEPEVFVRGFSGAAEVDESLLFITSLEEGRARAAQLYRHASGALEPDLVHRWPSSQVTGLIPLPGGCGRTVLRFGPRVGEPLVAEHSLMLYGADDEFVTEALAIPADDDCRVIEPEVAYAPGRLGLLWRRSGCEGGVRQLSFRWFELR